ncbi:unnamed protein product, partial [Rotaria sp. Silwood1]
TKDRTPPVLIDFSIANYLPKSLLLTILENNDKNIDDTKKNTNVEEESLKFSDIGLTLFDHVFFLEQQTK